MTALKLIKDKLNKFKKLRTKEKVKLVIAMVTTVVVLAAVPTLAWFSYQKKMATMAKIDSPAKLSLKAGAGEDIINFKMSGIDTNDGSSQDFVFCVEGEDISQYHIQLAHTTNINFSYSIYRARETESTGGIPYPKASGGDPIYYEKVGNALSISTVNGTADAYSTRTLGNDQYEDPSYKAGDIRQRFAEPLYWQTASPILANDENYDEFDDDESAFRNYYVLEVSWGSDVTNDKETDIIYLTAQVA